MSDRNLTNVQAVVYSCILTVAYVGILYVSKSTRPSESQSRDDFNVIYHRINTISLFTAVVVVAVVPGLLMFHGAYSRWIYAWKSIGIDFNIYEFLIAPSVAVGITAVLFIGPLANNIGFERNFSWTIIYDDVRAGIWSLWGIRDYIIGPVTEELIFRGCIIAFYLASNTSQATKVFVTPAYFALAHIHHAWESYLRDRSSLNQALMVSALQFLYTMIFGWYVAYLFVSTHSIWACIAVHSFCNIMGLPPLVLDTRKKNIVYRGLLVVGIVGFYVLLPYVAIFQDEFK